MEAFESLFVDKFQNFIFLICQKVRIPQFFYSDDQFLLVYSSMYCCFRSSPFNQILDLVSLQLHLAFLFDDFQQVRLNSKL